MVYFDKSWPAPVSLSTESQKSSGKYNKEDVLTQLKQDFYNKCYLCECKAPNVINVEHFRPHMGNTSMKFDWGNLFWSCGHCNNVKLNKYTNIIDCTSVVEGIDQRIKINMDPIYGAEVEIENLDNNPSTIETTELLKAIYNGTGSTTLKRLEGANIKKDIVDELFKFYGIVNQYLDEDFEGKESHYKQLIVQELRTHLSNSSPFTAIKRWKIRTNEYYNSKLEQFIN